MLSSDLVEGRGPVKPRVRLRVFGSDSALQDLFGLTDYRLQDPEVGSVLGLMPNGII